ncbi:MULTISPECIES: efflux transporter outer membrane subunit [Butyricimonas]|uniref:efflux transporter outer membrane subunit n=1 Tax=Butyricimonas TaxID=574697 RepID=UPI0022E52899|nr:MULTISPECIES: TolC family protein [Butyricimonas]
MKHILIIILTAFLFTGCGVYKRYSRPEMNTSGLYGSAETADTTTIASLSWKELFADPLLQSLIEEGLQNNTDLKIARLRVEEAEASLFAAKLAYLPSLSLEPQGNISSFDGSKVSKTYNLAATASWEVDIFGRITNAKRGAKAYHEQSKAYEQAVQTTLVATIANLYYSLLMLDEQREISQKTTESLRRNVEVLTVLKRAGQANAAHVAQAEANLLSVEASLLTFRKETNELENALSKLLGRAPEAAQRGRLLSQNFPDQLAVGVPIQLLSNRPDVRHAEYTLAQAFYATNETRSAFYPSIVLGGSAGWTNSVGEMIINPGKWLLSAVGSLVQPVFNQGANTARLRISKAQQEQALLSFRQMLFDAGVEVNNALCQWQTARQKQELNKAQIQTLQSAVRSTQLLMQHGDTNYLEVLIAQQTLLQAELVNASDKFEEIQGVINLYHALGGGQF